MMNRLMRCRLNEPPGLLNGFLSATLLVLSGLLITSGCQSGPAKSTGDGGQSTPDSTQTNTTKKVTGPVRVSLTQAQYSQAAIQLGQPEQRALSTILKTNGVLDVPAQDMVSVSVPYGGYIRQIRLEPGMRVRKGDPLVTLENPDYIQFQQDYLDQKARLAYADLEYARQQELSRENVNALKVLQQTQANRQSLQAQLAGTVQRLAILRINPATLTAGRITRTMVVPSPVTGYVTEVPVNNGRFLNPSDVLVQIANTAHLHVRMNIFEKDIDRIHTGQEVRFGLQSNTGLVNRGRIFLVGKSIAADRTISVLAEPTSAYSTGYIPGAYVSAEVDIKTQPLPALPEAAVVSYGGQFFVYVLEAKRADTTATKSVTYQFRQVSVKTGVRENGYVAVTLPTTINPVRTPVVLNGAYSLLAKLNNSED